ncbi:MAG: hypothetical protein RIS09_408 [Actinomycetota bacterium]
MRVTPAKVLIAEELSPATIAALGPDFTIEFCDGANRSELLKAIAEVDAVLIRSATKIDAEALDAAKSLKIVARAGVGLDNVDVKAATARGVMVVNAPTSNIVSAAELAVGLLLASARNIATANASLKSQEWKRSKFTGIEIADKTVGIIGLGRIGMLFAERIAAFGVKLIAHDPYIQPARAHQHGITMVSLDELIEQSDFISIHSPKTPETIGMISAEQLQRAKPNLHIINAARGGLIDEVALYEALASGQIAGAAIDVFAVEPCTDSPLFELDNVVVTPHLGASTHEAQEKAGVAVAHSVRLALAGELVPDAVNVQGGAVAPELKPYLQLTEKLGHLLTSLSNSAFSKIEVEVFGDILEYDIRVLELSALKGVFQSLIHDSVSYVNAPLLAKERSVLSEVKSGGESPDHKSLVRVIGYNASGEKLSVAGTISGSKVHEQILEINEFEVDQPVATHLVLMKYHDRPGVVGAVGKILGDAGVNIVSMQVSPAREAEHSLMVLGIESSLTSSILQAIGDEIGAHFTKSVDF